MNRGSSLRSNGEGSRDESQSRRQLVLELQDRKKLPSVTVTPAPEALVQALADLLLEASGQRDEQAQAKGGVNESEDRVVS